MNKKKPSTHAVSKNKYWILGGKSFKCVEVFKMTFKMKSRHLFMFIVTSSFLWRQNDSYKWVIIIYESSAWDMSHGIEIHGLKPTKLKNPDFMTQVMKNGIIFEI